MDDAQLTALIDARIYKALGERRFSPLLEPSLPPDAPFMAHSTVAASDFTHPRYFELCAMMGASPIWHRKQWEWGFLAHHLVNFVKPGMRGLGFGCGTEPLPALMASRGATVVATDAPEEHGWSLGNQWSDSVERLSCPNIISDELLRQRVTFRPCDMTAIPDDLRGFDFTWSSCAFEHLGSLEAGMQFVQDSMRTLRPGGFAVHTTEFNLSSDTDTVDSGGTVLYRKQDMTRLTERLRAEGHTVAEFSISPTAHQFDTHIDVPPFSSSPHLRLRLMGYITTSAGILVTAGPR